MTDTDYGELFVEEAREHIQQVNKHLLNLERNPKAREHLDAAFRGAHTLKGIAAAVGYNQIQHLCAEIEEYFDRIRKGEIEFTSEIATVLFKSFDLVEEMVNDTEKEMNLNPILSELEKLSKNKEQKNLDKQIPKEEITDVRVKSKDLDLLINLVGEIMITNMRLEQALMTNEEPQKIISTSSRLISELQSHVMKIRLVPLEEVFDKFPRMVRDISKKQKKEIKFDMNVEGIGLDRTVIDAIKEPVVHMLRNAVDHGIETQKEREMKGKSAISTIHLLASREGDKVTIQIKDDGRGLDLESIKSKAVEMGIVTSQQISNMSDEEIIDLLGTPGLSTAKKVTDISGRGVGFNVVKSKIANVAGQLKVETKKDLGTSITLTIPLSLAVIGGLLITVSGEKYVIPISSINTTLEINRNKIELVNGRKMIKFRDTVIPIIIVSEVLGLELQSPKENQETIIIVVVNKGDRPYGLVIDSFERRQNIVIKTLDSTSFTSVFPNATILADGKVALILDTSSIIDLENRSMIKHVRT